MLCQIVHSMQLNLQIMLAREMGNVAQWLPRTLPSRPQAEMKPAWKE
jgi:hypothetical protein